MKIINLATIATLLASCSNGNSLMTSLLEKKKTIMVQLDSVDHLQKVYAYKSDSSITAGAGQPIWSAYADSAGACFREQQSLEKQLKALDFTIDSLSKMK